MPLRVAESDRVRRSLDMLHAGAMVLRCHVDAISRSHCVKRVRACTAAQEASLLRIYVLQMRALRAELDAAAVHRALP